MPTPAPLQHNVVATTSSGGTPNTVSAAFGSNNSAGSLLIAGVGINLAAASISGIIDSQGNAWSKAVATTMSTTLDGEIWYAPNSKAGANNLTITITGTTGARVTTVDLVEVSNVVASSPLDKTSSNQGTASAGASQAGPTTQAGEFLFGFVARAAVVGPTAGPTDNSSSPAITWNALDEVHSQNPSVISAYGIQPSVGSFAVKWTTSSVNFIALEASFFASVIAAVPGKRYSRKRQHLPLPARKRLVNRIHQAPSPLGAAVLFAPVKRAKPARKPHPERPRAHRAARFKGAVFNLATFFFVVPRRNRKLPKKYILYAAPPVRPPVHRKLSAALGGCCCSCGCLRVSAPTRSGGARTACASASGDSDASS
jgi:hypothetical protein